jgi:hypothetical protein
VSETVQDILFYTYAISYCLKVYFHFQLFKKAKGLDINYFDFYYSGPFDYLYAKFLVHLPFYLFKSSKGIEQYKGLNRLIILLSWICTAIAALTVIEGYS